MENLVLNFPAGGMSRSLFRRTSDPRWINRYLCGDIIDIGGNSDPLYFAREFFPRAKNIFTWGIDDGDAQHLAGVQERSVDCVFSSHCLEHMTEPIAALRRWAQIPKDGGFLCVEIPEYRLYERSQFPSKFNHDHKWTFSMEYGSARKRHHDRHVFIDELFSGIDRAYELERLELLNHLYPYALKNDKLDYCLFPYVHSAIEFVFKMKD